MHVKICGITNRKDALAAARLGADFVGLIRAASPRQIPLETAREVVAALPPTTQPVLLFQDAPLEDVVAARAAIGVRWLQLHGNESLAYVRELRERCPDAHLIKAWPVSGPQAAGPIEGFLRAAARDHVPIEVLLLDVPKNEPHPGFAALAAVARHCRPQVASIWCAGGLTAESLPEALGGADYDGVDVARGVERAPGVKDLAALKSFIATARELSDAR